MITNFYKNFKLKNKIILLNIVIAVIIVFVLYFIIIPNVEIIKKIQFDIQSQLIELENKYKKSQSLRQVSDNLKQIEPQISLLDQVYIKQDQELLFITALEDLATKNHITQKLNLGNVKVNTTPQKSILQINTQGNFVDQIGYLRGLESLNYYINIKTIEIYKNSTDNQESTSMTLVVDTYWQ